MPLQQQNTHANIHLSHSRSYEVLFIILEKRLSSSLISYKHFAISQLNSNISAILRFYDDDNNCSPQLMNFVVITKRFSAALWCRTSFLECTRHDKVLYTMVTITVYN